MNIWDILILTVIGIGMIAAVVHICRNKNTGCSGCCAECGKNCPNKKEEKIG